MRRDKMYRRGYDRDSFGDMELEMMRREMMYRYGDDLDPEELEELLMEMKPSEEELKRRDRQELIYWINSQMLPPKIRSCHNHHDLHDTMTRYVRESKFGAMIADTRRFEVYYVSEQDVPTEKDFYTYLCRFTSAALNNRESEDKSYVLLCGVEEDMETKIYPLATGISYLDPSNNEEMTKTFRKMLCRSSKRRYGIKDAEFSSSDEGMTKLTVVRCEQKAQKIEPPYPAVCLFSVHPLWVYTHEWSYLFGPVDENRRYHPMVHTFEDGKPAVVQDPVIIQELEQNVSDSYQYYRKNKGYI
jgi:hypothetical protein